MTSPDLAKAAQDIMDRLPQLAQQTDLRLFWQEALTLAQTTTHASGVWLRLTTPSVLQLEIGDVSPAARQQLEDLVLAAGPVSETPAPFFSSTEHGVIPVFMRGNASQPAGCLAWVFPSSVPHLNLNQGHAPLGMAVQALAALAQKAHELQQAEDRLSRLRHLYEVGQAISSTLDLAEVLQQSTERIAEVLHAEASTLMLVDEVRQELVFTIPAGPAEQFLRELRMPLNKGVAGWVATHGQPLLIADAAGDARFYTSVDLLSGFRTRAIMAVPLQVKGKIIGVAEVINKRDGSAFTTDDEQWLSILAPLIAAAIDNARLFAALREEHDHIIAAEEKVRHELARDLHDGPAQILAAIILNIDMARRQLRAKPSKMAAELNYLESLAQEANHEIRNLLFSLRPLVLETHGLTAALRQLVERHQQRAQYPINLEVTALSDEAVGPGVANTVFVIVQEALNNIFKHARAQKVVIRLGVNAGNIWVEVEDDGMGINLQQVERTYSERGSFGLLNIRERARLIEGSAVLISPLPDGRSGTLVRVEAPLRNAS